jgi:hypothetical protein
MKGFHAMPNLGCIANLVPAPVDELALDRDQGIEIRPGTPLTSALELERAAQP